MENETQRPPTFGEQLVGLTFNPSGNPEVQKAKELCAELADMVEAIAIKNNLRAYPLSDSLYTHTIGQILNAQMNVVKLITIK
jgi:hypothetical protein